MGPTPEAAHAIARAAYIFLYPLVVNYGAAYQLAIDPTSGSGGFGRWHRRRTVAPISGGASPVQEISCTVATSGTLGNNSLNFFTIGKPEFSPGRKS